MDGPLALKLKSLALALALKLKSLALALKPKSLALALVLNPKSSGVTENRLERERQPPPSQKKPPIPEAKLGRITCK